MPRKKKVELRKMLPPIYCKGCGAYLIPKTRKQHYCNEDCREAYYDRTYWPKTETDKICAYCHSPFKTTKPTLQDYCNPDCREAARLERYNANRVAAGKQPYGVRAGTPETTGAADVPEDDELTEGCDEAIDGAEPEVADE